MKTDRIRCAALLCTALLAVGGCTAGTRQDPLAETAVMTAASSGSDAEPADRATQPDVPRFSVEPHTVSETVSYEALIIENAEAYPALQVSLNEMNAAAERLGAENARLFEERQDAPYDRRTVEIKRADPVAVSVLLIDENSGGGNAYVHIAGETFDTQSGTKTALSDVITSPDALPLLLWNKLKSAYPQAYLIDAGAFADAYSAEDGSAYVWTLSGDGITFWFEAGTVAPYHDGLLAASVSFAEEPALFDARYTAVSGVSVTEISENERESSMAGDIVLRRRVSETIDGNDSVIVSVGDHADERILAEKNGTLRGCIIHDGGRISLLMESRADRYHATLRLYDLTDGTPRLVQTLPGVGLAFAVTDEGIARLPVGDPRQIEATETLHLLGTAVGTRTFERGADGLLRTHEALYRVSAFDDTGAERVLTVKKPLSVPLFDLRTKRELEAVELPPETVLHYALSYSDGRTVFTTDDGRGVMLAADVHKGTMYADTVGGVEASELLDGLWYEEGYDYAD